MAFEGTPRSLLNADPTIVTEYFRSQEFIKPERTAKMFNITAHRDPLETTGVAPIHKAKEVGLIGEGGISCFEASPTLRCGLNCLGCEDSTDSVKAKIKNGLMPRLELRAKRPEELVERVWFLHNEFPAKGGQHGMWIGGTIVGFPPLSNIMNQVLEVPDLKHSLFDDGVSYLTNDGSGEMSDLMRAHLYAGWLYKVATHFSFDYPYGMFFPTLGERNLLDDKTPFPVTRNITDQERKQNDYSRKRKAESGQSAAKRFIDNRVRRVVMNTVISTRNARYLLKLYEQMTQLARYAQEANSPTQVGWTVSPLMVDPYHIRGNSPKEHSFSDAIQESDLPQLSADMSAILEDDMRRDKEGKRLLYNSTGYLSLFALAADSALHREVLLRQHLPFGRVVVANIDPLGNLWCDPMVPGPEEITQGAWGSIYGYSDRPYKNSLYSQFVPPGLTDRPNLVTT
ncbi:hypothetical protein HY214_04550 [Candidatus Roizmanbacteria bacterium]|nr:hypothetical protein [Candidatus Roizmanbacteria bacterium]